MYAKVKRLVLDFDANIVQVYSNGDHLTCVVVVQVIQIMGVTRIG